MIRASLSRQRQQDPSCVPRSPGLGPAQITTHNTPLPAAYTLSSPPVPSWSLGTLASVCPGWVGCVLLRGMQEQEHTPPGWKTSGHFDFGDLRVILLECPLKRPEKTRVHSSIKDQRSTSTPGVLCITLFRDPRINSDLKPSTWGGRARNNSATH